MACVLIAYSTVDGHTLKIARSLAGTIERRGCDCRVLAIDSVDSTTVGSADCVVIGASIRYGRHRPSVSAFIQRNIDLLRTRPGAFFSVNLVARKPGKSEPERNPYCRRFLQRSAWKPQHVAVFAGRLDYPAYSVFDRALIRLIMWITGGPTDPKTVVEFTDWQQVRAFGEQMADLAQGSR